MLDLCSGTKGASSAFRAAGWDVVAVDNDPQHAPDVVADLTTWSWGDAQPDLVWASPPCTDFSRESMPWCRTGETPSMELVNAALRIIRECRPTYWVLENVRGALPYLNPLLGPPRVIAGPFHLWGHFPPFRLHVRPFKERLSSRQHVQRAAVPARLSAALLAAVTMQTPLDLAG